jgi:membrane protease subunit HflK
MAHDPNQPDDPLTGDVPSEERPLETESPRRAASVQFDIEGDVGAAAAMREAMDPANQSLADALRLSYRVLQIVIVLLIALFVISGFKTIEPGQTGVATTFGRITDHGGLQPGLELNWPAPIGSYDVFERSGRYVSDENVYTPSAEGMQTQEQAIDQSTSRRGIRPGRDGSLLTADGGIMHMKIGAYWEISDAIGFSRGIDDTESTSIVRLVMQNAAVGLASTRTMADLNTMSTDEIADTLQSSMQSLISDLHVGITVTGIDVIERPQPPFTVQKASAALADARVGKTSMIEQAKFDARESMVRVIGNSGGELVKLINDYERSWEAGERSVYEAKLAAINGILEGDDVGGQVAQIVNAARGYEATIDRTLGSDYRRFAALLPAYREHPELVVRQMWLESLGNVLQRQDIEIVYVPEFISAIRLDIEGSEAVQNLRHDLRLNQSEATRRIEGLDLINPFVLRSIQMNAQGPGRQLKIDGGTVTGRGR